MVLEHTASDSIGISPDGILRSFAGAGGVELQLGADSLKRSSNTWVSNSNAPRPRSRAP